MARTSQGAHFPPPVVLWMGDVGDGAISDGCDATTASLGSPEGSFEWAEEDPGGVWIPAAERGPQGPRLRHAAPTQDVVLESERAVPECDVVKEEPRASVSGFNMDTHVIGPRGGRHAPDSIQMRSLIALRSHAVKVYGAGHTFKLGPLDAPRCALERAVKEVWDLHLRHTNYDAANSCAQWWVELCPLPQPWEAEIEDPLFVNCDVGADLRWVSEDTGAGKVHPALTTITYLSPHGPPVLVLDALKSSGKREGQGAPPCTPIDTVS